MFQPVSLSAVYRGSMQLWLVATAGSEIIQTNPTYFKLDKRLSGLLIRGSKWMILDTTHFDFNY